MTDRMTPQQRHYCMSRIRGADTKPEMIVRRFLWHSGYRYRLHGRRLPGRPDIVIKRLRVVIFVNGCFWHGHNVAHGAGLIVDSSDCCKLPKSRRDYWGNKIRTNMLRDDENMAKLNSMGWHVIVVWECDLKPARRTQTLDSLLTRLKSYECPRASYTFPDIEASEAAESETEYGTSYN